MWLVVLIALVLPAASMLLVTCMSCMRDGKTKHPNCHVATYATTSMAIRLSTPTLSLSHSCSFSLHSRQVTLPSNAIPTSGDDVAGLLVHFRLESAKPDEASGMIPERIYSICTKESLESLGLSMLCSEMDPPLKQQSKINQSLHLDSGKQAVPFGLQS